MRSPAGDKASCILNKTQQRTMVSGQAQQRTSGKYLTVELTPERLTLRKEAGATEEIMVHSLGFAASHTAGRVNRAYTMEVVVEGYVSSAQLGKERGLAAFETTVHPYHTRGWGRVVEARVTPATLRIRPALLPFAACCLLECSTEGSDTVWECVIVECGLHRVDAGGCLLRMQVCELVAFHIVVTGHPNQL